MALASINPATGEVLGSVAEATASQVRQAIDAAQNAQPAWQALGWKHRASLLRTFRRDVAARRDEIAALITDEAGKPLTESLLAEVFTTLEICKHLEHSIGQTSQRVKLGNPIVLGRSSRIDLEPVGVVGVISPWNYPLSIPASGVLAALLAGNGVVLKPSEKTPLVGQWLVDALHRAGVGNALQIVQGGGQVGRPLVENVDAVTFTGSVATGQKVAQACANRMVPSCLELGGKDPMIVLPGKRPKGWVSGAIWGAFTNAGQTCASVERLYLPDANAGPLVDAAKALRVGLGTTDVDVGPLIDEEAVTRTLAHIRDAEKRGATIACGGERLDGPGFYVQPTVITGANHDMLCMREETFGPTLPTMQYQGLDEAIALANDSDFGLTASVWGPRGEARRVAQQLEAGTVMVNECLYGYAMPETPWLGWKQSGSGHAHGPNPFDGVTRLRHMHTARGRPDPWHMPYTNRTRKFANFGISFRHGRK